MKTKIICLAFLFSFHAGLKSQTDTLKLVEEYSLPNEGVTSSMNLAFDGTNLWLSEYQTRNIYKITTDGQFLDTINTSKPACIEFVEDTLWISHGASDWVLKLNKNTGQIIDSIEIVSPGIFTGVYGCFDLCYTDSAIYSVWFNCWCGSYRFLKKDLRTNLITDLGNIPLYNNLVVINDTIWAGDNELHPIFSNNLRIENSNRSLYLGDFILATGLAFDNKNLWAFDFEDQKLKKFGGLQVVTSTKKIISEDNIIIFPNPVTDELKVTLGEGQSTINIYSQSGQLIYNKYTYSAVETISVAELNVNGFVFLQVIKDGQSTVEKVLLK